MAEHDDTAPESYIGNCELKLDLPLVIYESTADGSESFMCPFTGIKIRFGPNHTCTADCNDRKKET